MRLYTNQVWDEEERRNEGKKERKREHEAVTRDGEKICCKNRKRGMVSERGTDARADRSFARDARERERG